MKNKVIEEIGKEMVEQNHRITQNVMFVIQVDVKVPCPDNQADGYVRIPETTEGWCDECLDTQEQEGGLREDFHCENCDEEAFGAYRNDTKFDLTAGVFFTAKACEQHIKLNHYHYNNPKSFGIGSWRNFEMQEVQRYLIEFSGNEVPSHYK